MSMADWCKMWESLGLNLEAHDELLNALPPIYQEIYLDQENRPEKMEYFDMVVAEIHGLRIKELQDIKANGGKVVGTFCVYVPEEIVLAAGGTCIGLCAGVDIGADEAEKVLPRNICPLIKSFMGFKLSKICPYFESCDVVVGETTCDGKKKAFEVLSDFTNVYVMETPQKKEKIDKELWQEEVKNFKSMIEDLTGNKITEENLREAIKKVNGKRKALQRLSELRKVNPPPISGKDALLIEQIAFYDDVERFTEKVNELCDELKERIKEGKGVVPKGTRRIIVSGTPMAIPNWKVPHIVERSGAVIVAEELCTGLRYFQDLTPEGDGSIDEMLKNIAERHIGIDCAVFTPNGERAEKVARLFKEYNASGVIHYTLSFCDPYAVEAYQIEKVMKKEGIPLLKLETDYSQEDAGQLKTRVEAFLEMVH
jgi:benzoyl-CoA reductase/2-hydroxyglutaryl-CoA dehydratase subunit BcrC/BadD/HgdB